MSTTLCSSNKKKSPAAERGEKKKTKTPLNDNVIAMNNINIFPSLCQQYFRKISKKMQYWIPEHYAEGLHFFYNPEDGIPKKQTYCKANIDSILCEEFRTPRNSHKRYKEWKVLVPQFWQECNAGEISDDAVKEMLSYIWKNIPVMRYERENGEICLWTGNCKGTVTYNKRMAGKVRHKVELLADRGYQTFALTLTCDISQYGFNYYSAWKHYTEEIHDVLEYYRKHKGLKYVWVKEATKKGAPHVHCVLAFPKNTWSFWDKCKNQTKIKYGELFKEIKKRVKSPVFHLEVIKGATVKWYLTKYISKASEYDLGKLADKDGAFSQSERKEALGLCCSVMAQVRLSGGSQLQELEEAAEELKAMKPSSFDDMGDSESEKDTGPEFEVSRKELRRLRRNLIEYVLTRPMKCCQSLMSAKNKNLEAEIKRKMEAGEPPPEDLGDLVKSCGTEYSCKGCLYSHFYNFLKTGDDRFINLYTGTDKKTEKPTFLFDNVDKNNIEEWWSAVLFVFEYYFKGISLNKLSILQLAERLKVIENEDIYRSGKEYKNYRQEFDDNILGKRRDKARQKKMGWRKINHRFAKTFDWLRINYKEHNEEWNIYEIRAEQIKYVRRALMQRYEKEQKKIKDT